MFFIKLEDSNLEHLLKLSAEKKMRVERLAQLAFLKGLRLLAKDDAEIETAPPEVIYHGRLSTEQIEAHIREHWQQKTDKEMGAVFGYGRAYVGNIRRAMGLTRKKGRPQDESVAEPSQTKRLSRKQRHEQLDALIREHWETKDDAEIGCLMEPPAHRQSVFSRRRKLGLKRTPGNKHDQVLREL